MLKSDRTFFRGRYETEAVNSEFKKVFILKKPNLPLKHNFLILDIAIELLKFEGDFKYFVTRLSDKLVFHNELARKRMVSMIKGILW